MERWQMSRFGFVNFWVYDREVFEPSDGKILIRGSNGSGKSITTQSFIPYILDGDRQPTRLDPFGSRDRKMDFYLIGDQDSEKQESTGYIWMEFVKPQSKQYRTIGIGLHAKKGGKMNTWGFCILDGRRVELDFFPYKEVGSQIIPYDAKTLRKELGDENLFTERPTEYKAFVADKIFGISKDRMEDFDQLTNILIKTRSSKLASKENLKPVQLYDILNDSLRTLSDDDLHPMADAMSKIEDAHARIESSEIALREATALAEEYDRYNRYMLWMKARRYLEKNKQLTDAQKECELRREKLVSTKQEIEETQVLVEKTQGEINALKAEMVSLHISDIQNQIDRREEAEENLKAARDSEKSKKQSIQEKDERISEDYIRKREQQNQLDAAEYTVQNIIDDLSDFREDDFPFYDRFLATLKDGQPLTNRQYSYECGAFRQKAVNAHETIRKYETKKEDYLRQRESFEQADDRFQKAESIFREALGVLEGEKDEAIEKLYIAARSNKEFTIDDLIFHRIESVLSHYEGAGSAGEYLSLLSGIYKEKSGIIERERAVAKAVEEEKERQCRQLRQELETLQNTPEPVPVRSEQRLSARKALSDRGIPFRSFYECVDFKETVPDPVRCAIEAELADMGMLDALVIPEEYRQAAVEALAAFADSYLWQEKKPPIMESSFFEIVTDSTFTGTIGRILAAFEESAVLMENGFYRNGVLCGHSVGEKSVSFIGAENRRKYRQRLIDDLSQRLDEAVSLYDDAVNKRKTTENRMVILDEEFHSISDLSGLDTALNILNSAKIESDATKKYRDEQEQACAGLKAETDSLFEKVSIRCAEFPNYPKTSSFFAQLILNLDSFKGLLEDAAKEIGNISHYRETLAMIDEKIETEKDDRDLLQYELGILKKRMGQYLSVIDACDKILKAPDNLDRTRRFHEINDRISTLEKQKRDYEISAAQMQVMEGELQKSITATEEEMDALAEQEHTLASYFTEELALGFLPLTMENKTHRRCADEAISLIIPGDEQKNISDISGRLNDVFRNKTNQLSSEYRLMSETIFENSGPDTVRSRMKMQLVWQGKQVAPSVFRGELEKSIAHDKLLLNREEENMFREILLNTISKKLSNRVRESSEWVGAMSDLMTGIHTSMGLTFRLKWMPKKDLGENELPVEELNKLLAKDSKWISADDISRLTNHFRSKIEYERRMLIESGEDVNYEVIIRKVLDYRNWYEFRLQYKEPTMSDFKELANHIFNRFSGGERALSLYIPLFAAVAAQYEKAGPTAPKIVALDEAFAGVDESNISEMFALMDKLEFGYIINSQALWGTYSTVKSLSIAELLHDKHSRIITVIRYLWNGKQKKLID